MDIVYVMLWVRKKVTEHFYKKNKLKEWEKDTGERRKMYESVEKRSIGDKDMK